MDNKSQPTVDSLQRLPTTGVMPAEQSPVEVLKAAQRRSWRHDERLPVEHYQQIHPDVFTTEEVLLDFIWNEVMLRAQAGEQPRMDEYLRRFPRLEKELRERFTMERTLGFADLGSDMAGARPEFGGKQTIGRYEAEVIARIRHPNIVQIFDVGESAGQPFFAMEFCAGGSLAALLKVAPLSATDAARMVEQIAHGVAAAHQQHIIHRDLKPANVLLTAEPSAQSGTEIDATATPPSTRSSSTDGRSTRNNLPLLCKVTDFGLAKALDADDGQTRTGAVLGTPGYMAPEQAFGETKELGPAVDVYALGAILYECLTGRPPFRGATVAETLDQVRYREPVPIRQLQPRTPVDLETIALKCLHKEPGRRYESAEAVAADIGRFLDHRPILARPIGMVGRVRRWGKRNPIDALLLGAALVILLAGFTGTMLMWREAVKNLADAENNHKSAEKNFRKTYVAVHQYFLEISRDQLLKEPGMKSLRKTLLLRARPFFEDFVVERGNDPVMRYQLGLAITSLATIADEVDPPERGLKLWQEALAIFTELENEHPERDDCRMQVTYCEAQAAVSCKRLGRLAEAEATLLRVHARNAVAPTLVENQKLHWDLVIDNLQELATIAASRGEIKRAEAYALEALQNSQGLAKTAPNDHHAQLRLARKHFFLGNFFLTHGTSTAALDHLNTARKLYDDLLVEAVDLNLALRSDVAATLAAIGAVHLRQRQYEMAQRVIEHAHELFDQLSREHPTASEYRRNLAANTHNRAILFRQKGILVEAEKWLDATVEVGAKLHRDHLAHAGYACDLGDFYRSRAVLANLRKKPDDVIHWNEMAFKLAAGVLQADKANGSARHLYWSSAGGIAQVLDRQDKHAAALPWWNDALRFAPDDKQPLLLTYRAICRAQLGDWHGAGTDIDDARKPTSLAPVVHHYLACANGARIRALQADKTRSDSERAPLIEAWITAGLEHLKQAHRQGFYRDDSGQALRTEQTLEPFRGCPAFQKLLN